LRLYYGLSSRGWDCGDSMEEKVLGKEKHLGGVVAVTSSITLAKDLLEEGGLKEFLKRALLQGKKLRASSRVSGPT